MDKKHNYTNHGKSSKRLWITFLFFCIITTGFMQAANKVFAQATVTASFKNATLSEILWEIQRQTDFTFVYSTNDVKQIKVQNLNVNNEKIANVLDKCLMNSGLTYSVHNGVIAIKQIEEKKSAVPQQKTTLTDYWSEYLSQRYYEWNYYRFGRALLIRCRPYTCHFDYLLYRLWQAGNKSHCRKDTESSHGS